MNLNVTGVSFGYQNHPVLNNVTFSVRRGQVVGIVGPNGSGKSTLLRVISRGLTPQKGEVTLDGKTVHRMTQHELARCMAVVRQRETVAFNFTVTDVVHMGRFAHLGPLSNETETDRAIALNAMEAAGVAHLAHRPVHQLSGGEFQRVALARALAQDTPILLLDEPTSNLDLKFQCQVLQLLRTLSAQDKAILVSLHDLNLASQYCDQILILDDGRIRGAGPPTEVLLSSLLEEVYGVEVLVTPHPTTRRPLVFPQYHHV